MNREERERFCSGESADSKSHCIKSPPTPPMSLGFSLPQPHGRNNASKNEQGPPTFSKPLGLPEVSIRDADDSDNYSADNKSSFLLVLPDPSLLLHSDGLPNSANPVAIDECQSSNEDFKRPLSFWQRLVSYLPGISHNYKQEFWSTRRKNQISLDQPPRSDASQKPSSHALTTTQPSIPNDFFHHSNSSLDKNDGSIVGNSGHIIDSSASSTHAATSSAPHALFTSRVRTRRSGGDAQFCPTLDPPIFRPSSCYRVILLFLLLTSCLLVTAGLLVASEKTPGSNDLQALQDRRAELVVELATELRQVVPRQQVWRSTIQRYMDTLHDTVVTANTGGVSLQVTFPRALLSVTAWVSGLGSGPVRVRTVGGELTLAVASLIGSPLLLLLLLVLGHVIFAVAHVLARRLLRRGTRVSSQTTAAPAIASAPGASCRTLDFRESAAIPNPIVPDPENVPGDFDRDTHYNQNGATNPQTSEESNPPSIWQKMKSPFSKKRGDSELPKHIDHHYSWKKVQARKLLGVSDVHDLCSVLIAIVLLLAWFCCFVSLLVISTMPSSSCFLHSVHCWIGYNSSTDLSEQELAVLLVTGVFLRIAIVSLFFSLFHRHSRKSHLEREQKLAEIKFIYPTA